MPYIPQEDRDRIDLKLEHVSNTIKTPGELNYAITRMALLYIKTYGLNYNTIASVVGTLHLVFSELQRRLINLYEDEKIADNGDVPEFLEGIHL